MPEIGTDFSAVIFDMDGTLFATEQLAWSCLLDAFAAQGHVLPDAVFLDCVGKDAATSHGVLAAHFGDTCPVARIVIDADARMEAVLHDTGPTLKPGVKDMLDWLQQHGIACAIASASHRDRILQNVHKSGLAPYFTAVVGGNEVAQGKPAPDIYQEAARRLHTPIPACIAFEDSPTGFRAAISAGIRTILIPDLIPANARQKTEAWRLDTNLTHTLHAWQNGHFARQPS